MSTPSVYRSLHKATYINPFVSTPFPFIYIIVCLFPIHDNTALKKLLDDVKNKNKKFGGGLDFSAL